MDLHALRAREYAHLLLAPEQAPAWRWPQRTAMTVAAAWVTAVTVLALRTRECAHWLAREQAPARRRRTAILAATAWVAVTAVFAGIPAAGASPRTMATASRSAPNTAGEAVQYHAARVLITQTHRAATSYTVRGGDTLSAIAARICGSAGAWTGLYSANARVIGTNPNRIYPGQQLARSCARAAVPVAAARHASRAGRVWKVTYGYPYKCGDGDGDGYDTPCSAVFPRHYTTVTRSGRHVYSSARRSYSSSGYHGASGSYEACVIARESGGNSQVMNSSGHYGLYQFSASTWQAYGGSSADFGHASAAEQQRVFHNAIAQGGQSNWSPYDGC